MFNDPANILVFIILLAFVVFVIGLKRISDRADKEERLKKEESGQKGKSKIE